MMTNVINTLCPDPSYSNLLNEECIQPAKHSEKSWDDDQCSIKNKYIKLVLSLCAWRWQKKNSIEKKVCRAILYKGATNNKLNKLMKEHDFSLATDKAQVLSANWDFDSFKKGEMLTKYCIQISAEKCQRRYRMSALPTNGVKTHPILVVDFKMKFEAKSVREPTVEDFGKEGIRWHGCA